jgi:hypothetical protein
MTADVTTTVPPDNPACTAERHTAKQDTYRQGCRCARTVAAHEAWRVRIRTDREAALAHHRATGQCGARTHDSRRAYSTMGCRCPLSKKLYDEWVDRKPKRVRRDPISEATDWRVVVGRSGLMMLLAGYPDEPTFGERMVADIRLTAIRVPDGPRISRPLTVIEIAERLGTADRSIHRMRRVRKQLRANRHLRRLRDVQRKAERVARAIERKRG